MSLWLKRIGLFTTIFVILGIIVYFSYNYVAHNDNKIFQKSDIQLNDAYHLFEEEKYNEALSLIQSVSIELNSTKYMYYSELLKSQILFKEQKINEAYNSLSNFKIFLDNHQNNEKIKNISELTFDYHLLNAQILSQLEKYEESNKSIEYINNNVNQTKSFHLENEIEYIKSYNNYKIGNYDLSIKILNDIINKNELDKEVLVKSYNLLGNIYHQYKNDNETSIFYYQKSYDLKPDIQSALPLVEIYILLDKYDDGLNIINQELLDKQDNTKNNIEEKLALYSYQGILLYKNNKIIESLHSFKMSNQYVSSWSKENFILFNQDEINKFSTVNRMYLLYVYFNLKEYELAQQTVEEIKNSDLFNEEMKAIASKYEVDINKFLSIQNFQEQNNVNKEASS